MQITNRQITQNHQNINFKAKFLHSQDLENIVKYSIKKGKFEKLNIARKMIDERHLKARLMVELSTNENGLPIMTITKFLPNKNITTAATINDYHIAKTTKLESGKKMNPLKFGLEKLIKMGNNHADNKLFERVVLKGN
ncbi:MAG: hypothetical protein E7Z87_07055 [Cyanobacteria bacterium SIG26]|nr:hypothetical protein [Cyanobacteria bacterium SIG26]